MEIVAWEGRGGMGEGHRRDGDVMGRGGWMVRTGQDPEQNADPQHQIEINTSKRIPSLFPPPQASHITTSSRERNSVLRPILMAGLRYGRQCQLS